MDIKSLRKMSAGDFSKITGALNTIAQGANKNREVDERLWKLSPDKAGNASAIIRFLPKTEGDDLPYVKIIDHGFQGPGGKWYIEKSLATLDLPDPVSELNSSLWNNGTEEGKEQARTQKRRTAYYANILVISDPGNPSNDGQVRIFKFGKKIMDKIKDKAIPTFEDEKPVNVFDYWEGADFKLRQKKVDKFPNYDASVFSDTKALGSDDEILDVANRQYVLSELIAPDKFKTYDELKTKLDMVMNGGARITAEADVEAVPQRAQKTVAAPSAVKEVSVSSDDDDTSSADYFRKLAEG